MFQVENSESEVVYHCKNKIVKKTNLLVSTVARNSGNCNKLVMHVSCYGYTSIYNLIIVIAISLSCLLDVQKSIINILINSL